MTFQHLDEVTAKVKNLVRQGDYKITFHVLHDNPDRQITAADILEVLKVGNVKQLEPRTEGKTVKYSGADRYRWVGQDAQDRVLRLIVVVSNGVVIVSAAISNPNEAKQYLAEDNDKSKGG